MPVILTFQENTDYGETRTGSGFFCFLLVADSRNPDPDPPFQRLCSMDCSADPDRRGFIHRISYIFHETTDSARRYLVFPFCLDIFLVLVTGLTSFCISRSFPVDTVATFWAFALLMPAPTSAHGILLDPDEQHGPVSLDQPGNHY
jgi:hypothetical protein